MISGRLIGCGFFANNQLHGWNNVQGAEIVALCDRDEDKLKAAGLTFGITALYVDTGPK